MSDPISRPYKPVSDAPYGKPTPDRVGVVRQEPFLEHFCAVCGAGGPFGFGADLIADAPGVWACAAHKAEVDRKWKRG